VVKFTAIIFTNSVTPRAVAKFEPGVNIKTHVFKALFEFDQNVSEKNVVLVDFPENLEKHSSFIFK
jgi:hypothetical protein